MDNCVLTQVQAPAAILDEDIAFVIPSYQRPYVWPDDAVVKLFDDIFRAWQWDACSNYYIGTVLTAPISHIEGAAYELIDGQQRITTLMLIALAFRVTGQETALNPLAERGNAPRLTFAIREQVQALLGYWSGLDGYQYPGEDAVKTNPYLTRLDDALNVLKQLVGAIEKDRRIELAGYIHTNVQWVNNTMPGSMDLNRLFATMNTRGVQLEQSDILKSMLLRRISTDKSRYEAIWQACEQMDNYFERNVRQIFGGTDWSDMLPEHLRHFDPARFLLSEEQNLEAERPGSGLTISQLADSSYPDENEGSSALDLDDTVYCQSIIGFPLLLMHALRIYTARSGYADIGGRLHSERLIDSFSVLVDASETEVKEFVECLWEVRYQFDRWVVKWVERSDEDERQLRLTDINRSPSNGNWYLTRSVKKLFELVPLQSVRHFTGEHSAQYWLTPFLGLLCMETNPSENTVLDIMERIDNQLSLAEASQKQASFELLSGDVSAQRSVAAIIEYLKTPCGTKFEHYWFQKLEYLLWKRDHSQDEKVLNYRIVSRNSIEHVYAQNEEFKNEMKRDYLDAFGNLVLLNPSENSSYGYQSVNKKKADFKDVYKRQVLKVI